MRVIAGTTKGVFSIEPTRQVLACRGVRELVRLGKRWFAGTGAGLFASDDGVAWSSVGLTDHEVWQVRRAADGALYAGTQPARLFRSDDDGENWHEVESFAAAPEAAAWCVPVEPRLPGRARALVTDGKDPNKLWVGVEVGGIMRSRDRGETWQLTLPGDNPDLHMMFAHPASRDTLFASTGYGRLDGVAEMIEGNAGVFRSDDGGTTWRYVFKGITPRYARPMCIDPRAPHALTVAAAPTAFSSFKDEGGARAELLRTEDGGATWRSLGDASHSPSRANFHGLTWDPEVPDGVLVGTDTGEVWRVDGDAHWTMLASGLPAVLSIAAH